VEKLARYVDKEEKIWVKLIISAHVLERISQITSTVLLSCVRSFLPSTNRQQHAYRSFRSRPLCFPLTSPSHSGDDKQYSEMCRLLAGRTGLLWHQAQGI